MDAPKGTKWLELTKEKALWLWEKLNEIPGLWDDFTVNRPDLFFKELSSPDSVWLEKDDGNGILYLKRVVPGLSASGHVVYWDKRLRGREEFTMDTLRWMMQNIPLQKINLFLPDYAGAARNFAVRCGFTLEGRIRKWSYSGGRTFDVYVYGITREEAFELVEADPIAPIGEEDEDGELHGTDGDEIRSGEPGVRGPVHGLDQPVAGDDSAGHTVQPAGSGESE